MPDATGQRPDRNLALELVRTTEYAAIAASRWIGRGEKEKADGAAVDAMRLLLDTVQMDGTVVIGEGEKDEAPMLYNGEKIGDGSKPEVDIAVDPLEGTELCANGLPNSLAVIALAERGTMFDPGPVFYMNKMATSRDLAHLLDLDRPIAETLGLMAKERGGRCRRPRRDHARPPAPCRYGRGPARRRRPYPLHPARRRVGCADRRDRRLAGRPPVGHRRNAGGRALGRRDQVHRRQDHRQAVARQRRGAPGGHRRRATTSTRRSTPTAWCPATTCSSPPPASPTATPFAGSTSARAAPRPSRSSCARGPGRCAASARRHDRAKLRELTGSRLG